MGSVTFNLEGQAANAVNAFLKVVDAQAKAEKGFDGLADKSRRAKKDVQSGFGQQATQQLKSFAAGALGVGAAIGAITKALQGMHAERKRGAEGAQAQEAGLKRLVQVSETREEFAALRAMTTEIAGREALSLQQAANLVFTAKSIGLEKEAPLFGQASRFTDPLALIESVGKVRSIFKEEAGPARRTISQLIFGAGKSDVAIERLARAAIAAAPGFAAIGGDPEELIGFQSFFSELFRTPEVAGTRLSGLAAGLKRVPGVGTQGSVTGALRRLQSMIETDRVEGKTTIELLGKEGSEIFELWVANQEAVAQRVRGVEAAGAGAGTRQSELNRRLEIAKKDPLLSALFLRRQTKVLTGIGEISGLGVEQILREAEIERTAGLSLAIGESPAKRAFRRLTQEAGAAAGLGPEALRAQTEIISGPLELPQTIGTRTGPQVEQVELFRQLANTMDRMLAIMEADKKPTLAPDLNQDTGREVGP